MVAVFKNAAPAYKLCIVKNVLCNDENRSSAALDALLAKKTAESVDLDYSEDAMNEVLKDFQRRGGAGADLNRNP